MRPYHHVATRGTIWTCCSSVTPRCRRLSAAFGAVVAGRGGVALVSGEAGIGKSSLVRAFVAAESRATRVLAGRVRRPRGAAPARSVRRHRRRAARARRRRPDRARRARPPGSDDLHRRGRALGRRGDDRRADVPGPPHGGRPGVARRHVPRRRGRARPSAAPGAGRDASRQHAADRAGAPERRGRRPARGRGGRCDGPAGDHGRQPVLRPRGARDRPGPHAGERARRGPRPDRAALGRRPGGRRAGERDPLPRPAGAGGGVRGVRSATGSPNASAAASWSSTTSTSASVTSWRGGRSRSRLAEPGAGTSTGSCCTHWSDATRRRRAWRITPGGPATPTRSCGTASTRRATRSRRARIARRRRS